MQKRLFLAVAVLFSAVCASAQTFVWPVDNPQVTQVYGCRNCAGGTSTRYLDGINVHTGVDMVSGSYIGSNYNTPVRAAADGTVVKMVPVGSSHGLGNAIVLSHANGQFTLYGHLESFAYGLTTGAAVFRGQQIGIMGNSGDVQRDNFGVHLHFELKNSGVLGNQTDSGPYWGYTPGHPDQYGYNDPRNVINGLTIETLAPFVVQNPPPGALNVRSTPGATYFGATSSNVTEQIGENQTFVARKRSWADSRYWYFIDLPSENAPIDGGTTPNQGPNGGWIADVAVPTTGSQVASTTDGLRVRSGASTSYAALAKVHNSQRFAVVGSPIYGTGCSAPWYKINIPGDSAVTFGGVAQGWVCGDYLSYIP